MLWWRRRPYLLGNLGLVLFAAFLLAVWWSLPAAAAERQQLDPSRIEVLEKRVEAGKLRVTLRLGPLTKPWSAQNTFKLFLKLVGRDPDFVNIKGSAERRDIVVASDSVYATVYIVYALPAGVDVDPQTLSVQVYVYDDVLESVYLSVYVRPPSPPAGGPAPAPAPAPPPAEQAEAGELVAEEGRVTYRIDPDRLAAVVAAAADRVVLEIPLTVEAAEVRFAVPARALDVLVQAGKPVVLLAANLGVELALDAAALADLRRQVGAADLVFSAQVLPRAQAPAVPSAGGFRPAGDVLRIELQAASGSGTRSLALSRVVRLGVPYAANRLGDLPPGKLGVYRYDEAARQWAFVGGKVDADAQRVYAFLDHLSLYTALAYDKTFSDLAGHWARMDVELMAAKHVARGVDATRFLPNGSVTRAQFAALLVRALQLALPARPAQRFTDVAPSHWAYREVAAAAEAGLVTGFGDGRFGPDAPLTREQMAVMVLRALARLTQVRTPGPADAERIVSRFADAAGISAWAREAVAGAVQVGLVRGRRTDVLDPAGLATRAEAVVLVKRLLELGGRL